MFEKYVDRLLNQYLAPYINGISQSSGVSRFRGEAIYSKLSLKAEAFEFLKRLGIEISSSSLASLAIKIPWSALTTARITIELDTLEIDLTPTEMKDIPRVEDLLAEFRESKEKKVAAKVQELEELEKEKEQEASDNSGGFMHKVLHRILQKLVVTFTGGIVLRMTDTDNSLTYGLLLGSLGINSRDDAVADSTKFLKRCEVSDLSAFVQVGGTSLRYMFTPTNLRLDVDHIQNKLDAKLEILDSSRNSNLGCGMLTISRTALRSIMISVQALTAWQSFLDDLIKKSCRQIPVDSESLKGATRKQYTALYRQKQMNGRMEQAATDRLQAIEDAVPSRLIALWRIEVARQITIRKARTEQNEGTTSWFGNHNERSGALSEDDWADIIQTVEQEQEAFADVIKPDAKGVTMTLARLGVSLYEDVVDGGSRDHRSSSDLRCISDACATQQMAYTELCARLQQQDVRHKTGHKLQMLIENVQAAIGTTLHAHEGTEHYEWDFSTCFGVISITCDDDRAFQYEATADDSLAEGVSSSVSSQRFLMPGNKHVALYSRVKDNGCELITTAIKLPPVHANVSPEMITVAEKLMQLNLPAPPNFEKHEIVEEVADSVQVSEWQDWQQAQQEKIMETAFQEFERVKQSTLRFGFDIFIAAPQLKINLDKFRRVHINLGFLRCISEEEVTADHFNVQIDLTNTQVQCVSSSHEESFCHSVLEPISLEICLAGKTEQAIPGGKGAPLDVTVGVKLQMVQLVLNPQCSQLLLNLADTYKALLASDAPSSEEGKRTSRKDSFSAMGRKLSRASDEEIMTNTSTDSNIVSMPIAASSAPSVIEEEKKVKKQVNVAAAVTVSRVRLSLVDAKQDEVTCIDMKELHGSARKMQGNMSCSVSLQDVLVAVAGKEFITICTADITTEKALDLQIGKQDGGPVKVCWKMCPIVVSWRKEDVAALVVVAESCIPVRDSNAGRNTIPGETIPVSQRTRTRANTRNIIGPESCALASVGLERASKFPLLQVEMSDCDDALIYEFDFYFGGVEFNLFVGYSDIERVCSAWCSDALVIGSPLLSLKANVVRLHIDQFRNEESRGDISLQSIELDYGGDCIISPWRSDKAVFECEFRGYTPAEKGGPAHSLCIKALIRRISLIFLMRHLDSLLFNLSDSVLGALVYHAAAQAAEVAAEVQTTSVMLWTCFIESPVIQCARDVSVLINSPDWGSGKCLPPVSFGNTTDQIGRFVDASDERSERDDNAALEMTKSASPDSSSKRRNVGRRTTVSVMPSFDQCLLLMPGSIQAHSAYELESWQLRFVLAFRNCHIACADCTGYATGSMCEHFDWDLTVRPESPESSTGPFQIAIGVHVNPINVTMSQSQLVLLLDVINENWAYSRFFSFESASAPEGAEAAVIPSFASQPHGESSDMEDNLDDGYSTISGSSGEPQTAEVDNQFESTIMNVRIEFDSLHLTATYARRSAGPGENADEVPLVRIGITDVRMTFDMVMYYDGKDLLFAYGICVNSVVAEDFRPEEFRKSAYSKVITCNAESDIDENIDDGWKLIVGCEEGRKPWKPQHSPFYLTFATRTGSHYALNLKLEKPRIYCMVQLIVDTIMWVVNAFLASSIVQYGGWVKTDEDGQVCLPKPEQKEPMVFTFDFEINNVKLMFPTDPEDLAAALIQVETNWRTSFDYVCDSIQLKQFRATDTMIYRTEVATLGMQDRCDVQLIKLSYINIVLEYIMGMTPSLSMIVCSLPISARLSFGDMPYIVSVANNIGKDARRGAMSELFPLDRSDDPDADLEAFMSAEDATDTGILGSCGTLRLKVLDVFGVCAPGQNPDLGCSDRGVWVDAKFDGAVQTTMAPWCKLTKLPVPVSGFGAGAVPYDKDLMVELTLHRGRRGSSQRLGVLAFPLNLCAGRQSFRARRLMRSTSAEHSLFVAMEGAGPLELEFEAHFEARFGGMVTAIANQVPEQNLDDFLKSIPQLDEFLEAPVPLGPSGSLDTWRQRNTVREGRARSRSEWTAVTTSRTGGSFSCAPVAESPASLSARIFVTIESLEGLFLDDCRAKALPVLRFHAGLQSQLLSSLTRKDDTSQVLLDALGKEGHGGLLIQIDPWEHVGNRQNKSLSLRVEECTVGVQYLNVNAGCWEPVMERWTFDLFFNASENPQQGPVVGPASYPALLEVTLVSFTPLLLNVTPPLCSLASWLLNHKEIYLASFRGETQTGAAVHEVYNHRYRLWNLTGEEVRLVLFWPGSEHTFHAQDPLKRATSEVPLTGSFGSSVGVHPLQCERKAKSIAWQVFQPSSSEVGLDSLLGERTAEDWRESAAETVGCAIEFNHAGGHDDVADVDISTYKSQPSTANPQTERKRLVLPISSACEGILPLARSGASAICEVLAPHPSYHLLLLSSGLRIFNHTDRRFELRFLESLGSEEGMPLQNLSAERAPFAAPLSILPEKVAFPPEIATVLRLPSLDNAQADVQSENLHMQFMTKRSTIKSRGNSSIFEGKDEESAEDVQRLEPQHFCVAPPVVATSCCAVQLCLFGKTTWSSAIEVIVGEEPSKDVEVVIQDDDAAIRFRACTICSSMSSFTPTTSLHIYTPLRILNATPLKLAFTFEVDSAIADATYVPPVTVEAWSDYDLPPQLDPKQPYSLSLALADHRVSVNNAQRPGPVRVPMIFDTTGQTEELAAMPMSATSELIPSIFFTVSRGLTCSIAVNRVMIDRTPLGLRVLHLQPKPGPTQDSPPLPQVEKKLTLLCPVVQKHFRSASELRRMRYYLAMPQNADGGEGWSTIGLANFPETNGEVSYVSLRRSKEVADASNAYPVHVSLHTEDINTQLTLGTPCQIISVLPQVMIFNQVPDDTIIVRAKGDAYTEVAVMPKSSAQFLQWRPHRETKKSVRARLRVEFRPSLLKNCANWSREISISDRRVSQVVLSTVKGSMPLPNIMRLYLVEVVEQNGVVCVTINRGSKCELQNFSSIVREVTITAPKNEKTKMDKQLEQITSNLPLSSLMPTKKEEQETFCARPCETVEFSIPTTGNELQLRLVVQWSQIAGGSSTACSIADVYKPAEYHIRAPGGWHLVKIETGRTGEVSWVRLRDIPFQIQETPLGTYSTISKMVMGTFNAGAQDERKTVAKLRVGLSLASVGISLVSQHSERELVYAEVQEVGAILGMWADRLSVEAMISRMQVDSQLLESQEVPVLLVNRGEKGVPAFRVVVKQHLPMSRYAINLAMMGLGTDTLEVNMNDRFLLQAKDTVKCLMDLLSVSHGVTREQIESWHGKASEQVFDSPPAVPTEIVCEELTFMGLEVHIWARMRPPTSWPALRRTFQICTAGADTLEVNGARIKFDPEVFDNIRGAAPEVAKTLTNRYSLCFARSLCSILGRSSLVTIPALPITWGRKSIGEAVHMVDALLHRTFDIFELLTLDQQYVRRKRRQRQQRLKEITGLRSGLSTAALHLGAGLMHITDIIREPIAGAKQNGWRGAVVGLGRGIVGTAVKPIVEIGTSARSMTHAFRIKLQGRPKDRDRHVTMRRRPPRVMYSGGGIREYDEAAALLTLEVATASPVAGSSKMDCAAIEQARFGITDHVVVMRSGATPYIKHVLLLLTSTQLLLVDLDTTGIAVRWSVLLANFCGAQASSHGVIVWAWNPLVESSSPEDRIGLQVPSERVDVIQSILRMLQLLQPLGGERGKVMKPKSKAIKQSQENSGRRVDDKKSKAKAKTYHFFDIFEREPSTKSGGDSDYRGRLRTGLRRLRTPRT